MNKSEIKKMFLDFFLKKDHTFIKSSSLLIPCNKNLSFTNSGMNQFKNIFLGLENFNSPKVVTLQRCVRLGGKYNDLNTVGYDSDHLTFFKMLGNFSFGDYFKKTSIKFAWELLTDKNLFNISKKKLYVTVNSLDIETYNIWLNCTDIEKNKIFLIGNNKDITKSKNFWSMDITGPCGPCSEIYYYKGSNLTSDKIDSNFLEIWNLVFMEFYRKKDGSVYPLSKKSIDTGMGLERISMILQNVKSIYETDSMNEIVKYVSGVVNNNMNNISVKIISDHIRSCVHLINDGLVPENTGLGYILRKIIRRAMMYSHKIGVNYPFFYKLVNFFVLENNNIKNKIEIIKKIIKKEEESFLRTLDIGINILEKNILNIKNNFIPSNVIFKLHDTYGFPYELSLDFCKSKGIIFDFDELIEIMKKKKYRTRRESCFFMNKKSKLKKIDKNITTSFLGYNQKFCDSKILFIKYEKENRISLILDKTTLYGKSGGQEGDHGEIFSNLGKIIINNSKKYANYIIHYGYVKEGKFSVGDKVKVMYNDEFRKSISKNHTSTHILNYALQKALSCKIHQMGSIIYKKYLHFDFFYDKVLKKNEIEKLEKIINEKISNNYNVEIKYKKRTKDKELNNLRTVKIGNFSKEYCCGTHVKKTGEILSFVICSVKNISRNVKRIIAKSGKYAIREINENREIINNIINFTKSKKKEVLSNINKIINENLFLKRKLYDLNIKYLATHFSFDNYFLTFNKKFKFFMHSYKNKSSKLLKSINNFLIKNLDNTIISLFSKKNKKGFIFSLRISDNLTHKVKTNKILKKIINYSPYIKAGSNKYFIEGFINKSNKINDILIYLCKLLKCNNNNDEMAERIKALLC
ncbi:MAG: alanine--tRNA ligase [Enterobacteriaceae bacterium]